MVRLHLDLAQSVNDMRIRFLIGLAATYVTLLPATALAVCCSCAPPEGAAKACLTIDADRLTGGLNISGPCANLPMVVGDSLKGWACLPQPLNDSECLPIPQGVCTKGPTDAYTAGAASETVAQPAASQTTQSDSPPIVPNLNVDIPGFAFSEDATTEDSSSLLSQYITGVYSFGISVAVVAATVMFTYGAFLYLLGAAVPSIKTGKGIMIDAVFGLILVLSAVMILRVINPNTTRLRTLNVSAVLPYSDHEEEIPIGVTKIGDYTAPKAICRGDACRAYCNECSAKLPLPEAPWIPSPQELTEVKNSLGIVIPKKIRPLLRKEAAEALAKAGEEAQRLPGGPYSIRVAEGYRPLVAQMAATCARLNCNTQKQLAPPGASLHGSGIAVDVQLWRGGTPIVTPQFPLSNQAKNISEENAKILQRIMASAGFVQYCPEIWHYEFGVPEKGEKSTRCPWPPPPPRR